FQGITPVCVPTGVKHLHHAAQKFDIGIYFEANGHGTVVFSEKFNQLIRKGDHANEAVKRLHYLSLVINDVVGDAIADLLVIEVLLRWYGYSLQDWETALYTYAPTIQVKIPVADRSRYKTTYEETILLEPKGVQEQIDDLVNSFEEVGKLCLEEQLQTIPISTCLGVKQRGAGPRLNMYENLLPWGYS
ncbi:unnamed protein product, partial [Nippostrongylus brasiliensis]|uniref:LD02044p (inferred by orthology to a D. melanogaster protein) n=1 Tax=Nippostrongylus brasiliensis TaxID=27835 RepID=A0A0N4XSC0_NIPBR